MTRVIGEGSPLVHKDRPVRNRNCDQGDRNDRRRRRENLWPTFSVSVLLGLVSGTLYGFGRYSRSLKDALGLTQSQIERFGILLDTGNYVGHPLTGYVYDQFGTRASCLASAVVVFCSYGAIHLRFVNGASDSGGSFSSSSSMAVFDAGFFLVGFGSGLGYIAALGSITRMFRGTPHLGRAVGLVAAAYGLCSTLVGITYRVVGLDYFFALWAGIIAVANVIGAHVLSMNEEVNEPENDGDDDDDNNSDDDDDGFFKGGSYGGGRSEKGIDMEVLDLEKAETVSTTTADNTVESTLNRFKRMTSGSFVDVTPILDSLSSWKTWTKRDFWLLFASFACTTGCGLFVINNISTMVQSVGGSDSFSGGLIFLLSICNCAGRIIMGVLADRPRLSKVSLFRAVSLLMAVALFSGAASTPTNALTSLVVTVALTAMAYGASWVLIVGILAEWFGNVDFGKDYGLIAMGPALSGMLFNSACAWIYQRHAADDTGICVGMNCYHDSYLFTGTAAVVGCLMLSFVSVR